MAFAISEAGVRAGVSILLESPLTLASSGAPVWTPDPGLTGSSRHRELFAQYKDEVDEVAAEALDWWAETLETHLGPGEHTKEEKLKVWRNRPAGPASFPGFVAIVRDYWLACDRLNHEVPQAERVPPWTFLLGWLLNNRDYEQVVGVLACMPYWPIGLDRDGNWV
jgi:hypothetical protein